MNRNKRIKTTLLATFLLSQSSYCSGADYAELALDYTIFPVVRTLEFATNTVIHSPAQYYTDPSTNKNVHSAVQLTLGCVECAFALGQITAAPVYTTLLLRDGLNRVYEGSTTYFLNPGFKKLLSHRPEAYFAGNHKNSLAFNTAQLALGATEYYYGYGLVTNSPISDVKTKLLGFLAAGDSLNRMYKGSTGLVFNSYTPAFLYNSITRLKPVWQFGKNQFSALYAGVFNANMMNDTFLYRIMPTGFKFSIQQMTSHNA